MSAPATAQAVRPPVHAPAPPAVQQSQHAPPQQDAPQRLLTSLSAIPAVQRKCASCAEDETTQMPVQPRLEVGPVNDPYEREADAIAGRVMAMRDPGAASAGATAVQRACAGCGDDHDTVRRAPDLGALTDEEKKPRMRAEGAGGGEHIAASAQQLTSGGSALPDSTRSFYESRMGRDLSDVRVYEGGGADGLNQSISARAFTYQNHIWLSRAESTAPSFTMAHELAHVLQQTAPGPLGGDVMARRQADPSRASAGRALVQRNMWQPINTLDARNHSETKHNDLQDALAAANPGLVTEVRIPGAKKDPSSTKSGVGDMFCGYADLYQSGNGKVPGVEVHYKAGVRNFRRIDWKGNCKGSWWRHDMQPRKDYQLTEGRPKITRPGAAPRFTHCNEAPTTIRLGDVKPGHNPDERKSASKQLQNYQDGLNNIAARINKRHNKVHPGKDCWTPSPGILSTLNIPNTWATSRSADWTIPSLEFRRSSPGPAKTLKPWGSRTHKKTGANRIRGRYSAVKDPKYTSGVWVYFIEPNETDLRKAMAQPSAARSGIKSASGKLDGILGCLRSTPTTSTRLCRRPAKFVRRLPDPRTAPRRVMRKTKVPEDKFNLAAWNARRTGVGDPKYATDNLKTTLKTELTEEVKDKVEFQGAVARGKTSYDAEFGGSNTYKLPMGAEQTGKGTRIGDASILAKSEFWSGKVAGFFGRLRARFGTLFGRAATAYEGIREKAHKAFSKTKFRGGERSALASAAKRAATKVLTIFGKKIMQRVGDVLIRCLEQGISAKISKMIEGDALDLLQQKADDARKMLDTVTEDLFDKVEAVANKVIKPIEDELKAVGKTVGLITTVVRAANTIARGLRIAGCLSGLSAAGWGAIITCLASLGDFVLSFFGASPIDWLAGKLIQSCANMKIMASAMVASSTIANLPTTIGRKVVEGLRDQMPPEAKDIFCDPATITVDPLKSSDFDCTEGGGGGDGTGSGGGGGSGQGSDTDGAGKAAGAAEGTGTGAGKAQSEGDENDPTEGGGAAASTDKDAPVSGGRTVEDQGETETRLSDKVGTGPQRDGVIYIMNKLRQSSRKKNQRVDGLTLKLKAEGYTYTVTGASLFIVSIVPDKKHGAICTAYFPSDAKATFETDDPNVPEEMRLFQVTKGEPSGMLIDRK